jgi:hypothetical protein
VAALLAGENTDLKALVLWAPVAHPEKFEKLRHEGVPKTVNGKQVVDLGGFPVGQAFFDVLPQVQPLQTITRFSAPSLVIHGTNDQSVPLLGGKEFAHILQRNHSASRFVEIENADHTFSSLAWSDRVLTLTREWFGQHLFNKAQ